MKIRKGTKLNVNHSRSGKWIGVATKGFDTLKDEWYPIKLEQDEPVYGVSACWEKGDDMSARKGLCKVTPYGK